MTGEFWKLQVDHEKCYLKKAELRLAWLKDQVRMYEGIVRFHKEKLAEAEEFLRTGK